MRALLPPAGTVTGPGALSRTIWELCRLCRALTLLPAVFQLLDGTDFEHVNSQVVSILQEHLQSESLELRRMTISSLVTLSRRPEKVSRAQRGRPPGAGLQALLHAAAPSGFARNREQWDRAHCPRCPLQRPLSASAQALGCATRGEISPDGRCVLYTQSGLAGAVLDCVTK